MVITDKIIKMSQIVNNSSHLSYLILILIVFFIGNAPERVVSLKDSGNKKNNEVPNADSENNRHFGRDSAAGQAAAGPAAGDDGGINGRRGVGRRDQPVDVHKPMRLADSDECRSDVAKFCGSVPGKTNFAVLDCLQNDITNEEEVSEECQHLIWSYKRNVTTDLRFDSVAAEVCASTLVKISECAALDGGKGMVISCLIEHIDNVTDVNCRGFLKRMESIVFSDYRLIYKFTERCSKDIERLTCGRVAKIDELNDSQQMLSHNQGRTLICLTEHLSQVSKPCKHEVLRVAELQADDYHKDRPLYYACRDVRETLCHDVKAGDGRVYKCLHRHKLDRDMNEECRKRLTVRQQLEQEDYKVNIWMTRSCHADIEANSCELSIESVAEFRQAKLSAILLCLEGAVKDGKSIKPECTSELKDVRRSLMEDYQVNIVLVRECSHEMHDSCPNRGVDTIHCLMDLARPKKNEAEKAWLTRISETCARALEDVLTEADVGDNYEIDPVLHEACEHVVATVCKDVRPGDGRVMACLMSSIDKKVMNDKCRESLMEVYYFITRNFRLDTQLYKACHVNATNICGAPKNWHRTGFDSDATVPSRGHTVFACLYHDILSVHDANEVSKKSTGHVSPACAAEVRRVMMERSVSVDLPPAIEEDCLEDLARHCSEKTEKNDEVECLEDNLEELQPACKKAITEYALGEAEDPTINSIFVEACAPFWDVYCQHALKRHRKEVEVKHKNKKKKNDHDSDNEDDEEAEEDPVGDEDDDDEDDDEGELADDLMTCLIQYKHHPQMNEKCFVGVEHHQFLTLKDYRFSAQFMEACQRDVLQHCPRNKFKRVEVVLCLSECVRNDTMMEVKPRIAKRCRKQLKFELFQRSENIKLDPEVADACSVDLKAHCVDVVPGSGATMECLRRQKPESLTLRCKQLVFQRALQEAKDPMTDFMLISKCKTMIKKHCVDELSSPDAIFICLQRNKDEESFDRDCHKAVLTREELHAHDIRLNPELEKRCSADARKFCSKELNALRANSPAEGLVIVCLRNQFSKKRLSESCEDHVRLVIKESAQDFVQDVSLVHLCSAEIKNCSIWVDSGADEKDGGRMQDCLKRMVLDKLLTMSSNTNCYMQVRRVMEESLVDIHADAQLFKACAGDINHHCSDIPRGEGRHMTCLIDIFKSTSQQLNVECNKTLAGRMEMWKMIVPSGEHADTVVKFVAQAYYSPSRNYFAAVTFVFVGVIFIGGIGCGKFTRRVRRDVKDR